MTIAKIVDGRQQEIISCSPQDNVQEAARRLSEKRIGCLPVLSDGEVVGIFSERDLLYCVAKEGEKALQLTVGEVMTAPAITIDKQTDALQALSLMTRRRIRHLPVTENGEMVAFVSIGDLVKHRIDLIETEAEHLRDYITMS